MTQSRVQEQREPTPPPMLPVLPSPSPPGHSWPSMTQAAPQTPGTSVAHAVNLESKCKSIIYTVWAMGS